MKAAREAQKAGPVWELYRTGLREATFRNCAKDPYLKGVGIRVLRLPNGLVAENPEEFVRKIRECAAPTRPLTRPAPAG